jgi:hypothetical protein
MTVERVYLSRRNLEVLLSKLNRKRQGESTACTLIKSDNSHPKYPQTMDEIHVTAVEDDDYYTERPPGIIHPSDIPK